MGLVDDFLKKGFLKKVFSSFEVLSFLPGRIRIHSRFLVQNEQFATSLKEKFLAYKELEEVRINLLTGSLLILYTPEILRTNPFLRDLEKHLAMKARRK